MHNKLKRLKWLKELRMSAATSFRVANSAAPPEADSFPHSNWSDNRTLVTAASEAPDLSAFLYDATSGFYYDPQTTLYYDPNSRVCRENSLLILLNVK